MMDRTYKSQALSLAAVGLLGGCAAMQPQAQLTIRPVQSQEGAQQLSKPIEAGMAHLRLGQNADAISSFRAALRDNPESAEAHNGLAIAYDRIGRTDLAQRYFELAMAHDPANVKYGANLALLSAKSGLPQLAQNMAEPPTAAVSAQPPIEPVLAVAIADAAPVAMPTIAPVLPEPPVPTNAAAEVPVYILAEFAPQLPRAVASLPIMSEVPQAKAQVIEAVYRPKAAMPIRAAAIDTNGWRQSGQPSAPWTDHETPPLDMPRQPALPQQRSGVRLERVSLGEVRLVTYSDVPALAAAPHFDGFGARLSTWLPAAIALERPKGDVRMALKPELAEAVARATIENAIADIDLADAEEPKAETFTYAFFTDEGAQQVTLASL
jgi:tetratricopeptide (TPR) repeat protein